MRKGRSKSGSSQRPLPESLTQHLSDPKIRVLRTPDGRKRPSRAAATARKIGISVVTLAVLVLAGGHLVHAW